MKYKFHMAFYYTKANKIYLYFLYKYILLVKNSKK